MYWFSRTRTQLSLNNTINHSLLLCLTLLLVVALGVGGLAYLSSEGWLHASLARSHSNEILKQVAHVFSTLQGAETGQRGYLLTGRDIYLNPYTATVATLPQELERLDALTAEDPSQHDRVQHLRTLVGTKLHELQETIDLRRNVSFTVAQDVVLTDQGHQAMKQIRQVITEIEDQETIVFQSYGFQTTGSAQYTQWLFLVLMGVDIILLLLIYNLVSRARRKSPILAN